jgi:hypothetical protein
MTRRLPRPRLAPLLHTWSIEFARVRRQVAALGVALPPISVVREGRELGLRRSRFWRVMNQRRRLYACHWAGYKPAWLRPPRISTASRLTPYERWGETGRKWLLSHSAPRIGRKDATSSEPGR